VAPYVVHRPDDEDPNRRRGGQPVEHERDAVACVPFVPWCCPSCGDGKPRTYSKRGRVRYHQCQKCQLYFRSIEIDPEKLRELNLDVLRGLI
jgi:rubredoxin